MSDPTQLRHELTTQGARGLGIVNAAAAAAVATFLQSIWDKPDAAPLKADLFLTILFLAIGIAFAAVSFFPRYMHSLHPNAPDHWKAFAGGAGLPACSSAQHAPSWG